MSDFHELERDLRRLKPRATSHELAARVEVSLAEGVTATATAGVLPRRAKRRFSWFALALGGAAAAALVSAALVSVDRTGDKRQTTVARSATPLARHMPSEAPRSQPASSFVPDGLTRVVYHTRDEGLVYPKKSNSPVRRVRSRARETLQWKEPGTGASLRVSYPTEEVELIPVSGQ